MGQTAGRRLKVTHPAGDPRKGQREYIPQTPARASDPADFFARPGYGRRHFASGLAGLTVSARRIDPSVPARRSSTESNSSSTSPKSANCAFNSAGFAPVASNDTRNADINREALMKRPAT